MADFRRGLKAGVLTGIIYLAISAILGAVYRNNPSSIPHFIAGTGLSFLWSFTALTGPSLVINLTLDYIIRGIVFGTIFAALYDYLPSATRIVKGFVLSLFLWIVALVQITYTTPGWPWTGNGILTVRTFYAGTLSMSSVGLGLGGILSALVFGILSSFLWGKFRGKELAEERRGRSALLVGFILGGVIWVVWAVAFLMGVVIGGAPAITHGALWWESLLATSVGFVGLPGWIFALVAWRKTRRGETGFRWGVAGGIIMALTGQMLLPGVLAIIGGVFSRREPVTEPSTAEVAH